MRELNKANESANSTFTQIKRDAADVAAQFAIMAGVAAAAFATLTKASFASIDALAKTSDRLGIATETMKTFQVAADLAGVSQEKLEKALLKQQVAIVGAADGNVKLQETFRQLNLQATELINLPVDQQFDRIADSLQGIENPARRNALALEIFGARAAEIINLADEGIGGLGGLRDVLEDLNVTVSRFDAAKIEQANDAVSVARLAFEGLGNTIAVAVAPVVQGLAQKFTEAARASNGFKEQVASGMQIAAKTIAFVGDAVFGIKLIFEAVAGVALLVASGIVQRMTDVGVSINDYVIQPLLAGLAQVANATKVVATGFGLEDLAANATEVELGIDRIALSFRGVAREAQVVADNLAGAGVETFQKIGDALNGELPSTAVDRWFEDVRTKSEAAAAEMAKRMQDAINGGGLDGGAGGTQGAIDANLRYLQTLEAIGNRKIKLDTDELSLPTVPTLDPEVVRQGTELATQVYLDAWQVANEQRLAADQVLKDTLYQSDAEAGAALIQLAVEQARQRVQAEFEAKGAGLDEEGNPTDPATRAAFEIQVQEEALGLEEELLNRRLQLQTRFGQQYLGLQQTMQKLFGKSWSETHKTTLNSVAAFSTAAVAIGQSLFGENKKVAIATALISTYTAAAKALDIYGPTPQGFAAAAAALASGFQQVKSIQSTSATGGGGFGGGVGGFSGAAAQVTPASPVDQSATSRQSVQVIFQGDLYGWDDYMRTRVLDGIREAVSDRDVIIIDPRSRNAQDLVGG